MVKNIIKLVLLSDGGNGVFISFLLQILETIYKMKLLIPLILALILQGCFFQQIDSKDLKRGTYACTEHEGVYVYRSWWMGVVTVYCKDGLSYEL